METTAQRTFLRAFNKDIFKKTFFPIAEAGFAEGAAQEVLQSKARNREINPQKALMAGGFGAISAGTIGAAIASSAPIKPTVSSGLNLAANIADPFEKPGDITADLLEAGAEALGKAPARKTKIITASIPEQAITLITEGPSPGRKAPTSINIFSNTPVKTPATTPTPVNTPTNINQLIGTSRTPTAVSIPGFTPIPVPVSAPVNIPASIPTDVPISAPVDIPASIPTSIPTSVPISIPISTPIFRLPPPVPLDFNLDFGGGRSGGRIQFSKFENELAAGLGLLGFSTNSRNFAKPTPQKKRTSSKGRKSKRTERQSNNQFDILNKMLFG